MKRDKSVVPNATSLIAGLTEASIEVAMCVCLQVEVDEMDDEIAPYFKREVTPKVLITTTDRPSNVRRSCFVNRRQLLYWLCFWLYWLCFCVVLVFLVVLVVSFWLCFWLYWCFWLYCFGCVSGCIGCASGYSGCVSRCREQTSSARS